MLQKENQWLCKLPSLGYVLILLTHMPTSLTLVRAASSTVYFCQLVQPYLGGSFLRYEVSDIVEQGILSPVTAKVRNK